LCSQLHGYSDLPNNFVQLSFDVVLKTVTCLFIHKKDTSTKQCNIMYGLLGKTCNVLGHQSSSNTSDRVRIGLPIDHRSHQSPKEYCFRVTASNKTFTVLVEGSFNFNFTTSKCKHLVYYFSWPKIYLLHAQEILHWFQYPPGLTVDYHLDLQWGS
jgi:hypothetical protein